MKLNNRGFTLIEIMVVAGLLSGLSLVLVELTKQTKKSSTKFQYDTDVTLITNEILGILAKADTCKTTFNPTGTANVLSPTSITDLAPVTNLPIAKFRTIAGGGPASGYGNAGISVLTYNLTIDPYPSTDGKLEIIYKNKNILQGTSGLATVTKKITLFVERGAVAPNYINNCSPIASSFSDIWSRVVLAPNNIYYNIGNVGVGTATPVEPLDVVGNIQGTTFKSSNATAQSAMNGGAIFNGTSGSILIDDSGQKRVSWNDGAGQFNLRSGNYYNGASLVYQKGVVDANGGAATLTLIADNGSTGKISASVAPIGVPGAVVTYSNNFLLEDGIGFTVSTGVVGPPTERLRINTTGNVGIGTNGPETKLDVNGAIKVADETIVTAANCNINTEGSMRYHRATRTMQYCALIGASYVWSAFGSNEGIMVCPAGMVMVGSAGKRDTYCISTSTYSSTYAGALSYCYGLNDPSAGRAHLCSSQEFHNACSLNLITLPNNAWEGFAIEAGQLEEAAPNIGGVKGTALSGTSCSNFNKITFNQNSNISYRCCVR